MPRDPGRWLRPHPAASGPDRTGAGAVPPEPALPAMAPGGPGGGGAQPVSSGSQGNRCSGRVGTWPYSSLQENSQGEAALSGLSGSFGTGPPTRVAWGPRAAGLTQPEPRAAQVLGQPHGSPDLKELGVNNRLQLSWNRQLRSEIPGVEGEETRRASPRELGAGSPGGPEDAAATSPERGIGLRAQGRAGGCAARGARTGVEGEQDTVKGARTAGDRGGPAVVCRPMRQASRGMEPPLAPPVAVKLRLYLLGGGQIGIAMRVQNGFVATVA